MKEVICSEIMLASKCFLTGMMLTAAYDVLRLLCLAAGCRSRGAGDMLFWLVSSAAVFLLFLRENDGMLRWYAVGAVVCGMAVYDRTASRLFFHLLKKLLKYFKIKDKNGKRGSANGIKTGNRKSKAETKRKSE